MQPPASPVTPQLSYTPGVKLPAYARYNPTPHRTGLQLGLRCQSLLSSRTVTRGVPDDGGIFLFFFHLLHQWNFCRFHTVLHCTATVGPSALQLFYVITPSESSHRIVEPHQCMILINFSEKPDYCFGKYCGENVNIPAWMICGAVYG